MRIRSFLAAAALACAAPLAAADTALAQDRDCPDFPTQIDAQAALNADPADGENLDADGDRVACDEHFGDAGTVPVADHPDGDDGGDDSGAAPVGGMDTDDGGDDSGAAPVGGVETGGGGTADDSGTGTPIGLLLGASGLVAGGVAAAGVAVVAHRSARRRR